MELMDHTSVVFDMRTIYSILGLLLFASPLRAQLSDAWRFVYEAQNNVVALAQDSIFLLYAGSTSGVHRSGDDGRTWYRYGTIPDPVNALAADPAGTIYANTYDALYRSNDRSVSWTKVYPPQGMSNDLYKLAVDSNGVLYGSSARGTSVSRSTNGGQTWERLFGLSAVVDVMRALRVTKSQQILVGGFYGIWGSVDGGESWTLRTPEEIVPAITAFAEGPGGVLYAGSDGYGLFVSRDGGLSWDSLATRAPKPVLDVAVDAAGAIYAATSGGRVLRSSDDGVNWSSFSEGLVSDTTVSAIIYTRDYSLIAGCENGAIYRRGSTAAAAPDEASRRRRFAVTIDADGRALVRYALTRGDHVRIDLVDTRGAIVERLVDASPGPGDYIVSLAPRAGLHFVRIVTSQGVEHAVLPPAWSAR
jgi:photosystem II stability/assembly factor-like uncharacterized protein